MPKRHFTLYCDESAKKGPYFSDFYGGVVVASEDREGIERALRSKKEELNLFGELKWTKITENYCEKYVDFIRLYFSFIRSGRLKVRIMFTQNSNRPTNLTSEHLESRYFLLYYQLIKHAFGFRYCNPNSLDKVYVSVLLDDMPDTKEKVEKFKEFVSNISETKAFSGTQVFFPKAQMADINSKDHSILQGLDIILGSMNFRLNDLHKEKPAGKRRRGKRTVAKEVVYKEINRLICSIRPRFNVGANTGRTSWDDTWPHPYRHWLFVAKQHEVETGAGKPR